MKNSIVATLALLFLANLACTCVQAMNLDEEESSHPTKAITFDDYPSFEDLATMHATTPSFDADIFESKGIKWGRAAGVPTYDEITQAGIIKAEREGFSYLFLVKNEILNQYNPVHYSIVEAK